MANISENEVEKLLPCPFCGGKAEIDAGWAQCSERQCFMSDTGINPKIWNTRSDLTGAVSGGEALDALDRLNEYAFGDEDDRKDYETVKQALTRQPVENKPVVVTREQIREEFIIWNFNTQMNDLLYHLMDKYPHGIIIKRTE